MKQSCCLVCKLVSILVIIGALNWGTIAFFHFNMVEWVAVRVPVHKFIGGAYAVIGIAGVVKLLSLFVTCPTCPKK